MGEGSGHVGWGGSVEVQGEADDGSDECLAGGVGGRGGRRRRHEGSTFEGDCWGLHGRRHVEHELFANMKRGQGALVRDGARRGGSTRQVVGGVRCGLERGFGSGWDAGRRGGIEVMAEVRHSGMGGGGGGGWGVERWVGWAER
ncbi:hypothetical protein B1218_35725, partial [Pseudomonas ogarae]